MQIILHTVLYTFLRHGEFVQHIKVIFQLLFAKWGKNCI